MSDISLKNPQNLKVVLDLYKDVYFWSVLDDFDCGGNTYEVKVSW